MNMHDGLVPAMLAHAAARIPPPCQLRVTNAANRCADTCACRTAMNPAGCSGQQCRCGAGSPQIASRKYVQERHQRDQSEDPPRQLPAPAQVRPVGGQVKPHQYNGYRVQKTDQELEKLLHCPKSTRARRRPAALPSTFILAAPARASRADVLALGKRIQHALPGPSPLKITRQPSRPLMPLEAR
jgi:hypothetical protein